MIGKRIARVELKEICEEVIADNVTECLAMMLNTVVF